MKCAVSFSLVLVLLVFSLVPTVVLARQSDCQTWGDLAYSVFDRYNGIRQGRDIQTVAQMQALRREVEAFDISTCPAGEELYDTLIGLLNLSADSIVAGLVNDTALAGDLTFQSTDFYFKATELVAAGPPVIAGTITSPEDGGTADTFQITVEGSYDPSLLGDDMLWVFVKTPQQHYFPQVVDGCDRERRTSVALNPQRKTWSIPGFLGTATAGIGDTFEIILFSGGEAAQDAVFAYFDTACPANDYPGLSASDIYDSGAFTELHFIKVKRVA
jgi:hypothetical protein